MRPRLATATSNVVVKIIFLRLKLSATCPAGSVQATIGIICASPIRPSVNSECVRA